MNDDDKQYFIPDIYSKEEVESYLDKQISDEVWSKMLTIMNNWDIERSYFECFEDVYKRVMN
jgi:hypothetical protein